MSDGDKALLSIRTNGSAARGRDTSPARWGRTLGCGPSLLVADPTARISAP